MRDGLFAADRCDEIAVLGIALTLRDRVTNPSH